MSWFQLDPQSIAQRATAGAAPTLVQSLVRGMIGFTIVSVAGFVPWAITGRLLRRAIGEAGMYAVCAAVFIGLAGLFLHRLIIGTGSLGRFYKLFSVAFAAYSVAWIVGWMTLRGHAGSFAGLFAGTAIMGWMFARAFDAPEQTVKVIAALFVLNCIGYFVGGWAEVAFMTAGQMTIGMLMWGVCYGLGFGAGLGMAFYFCQEKARALIAAR